MTDHNFGPTSLCVLDEKAKRIAELEKKENKQKKLEAQEKQLLDDRAKRFNMMDL